MTTKTNKSPIKNFVTSALPWLLGAVMLVVFLLTINHWLTPKGLNEMVDIAGWGHTPYLSGPISFLVTYPFRWLPISVMPLALNLFSAVCATLCLVLLARSVALLPHDRTYAQRQREQSEHSNLSISSAWVPPVFAVLVCGLQLSFWEFATNATGEMFDLLLFAYVIRCLLEFRIDKDEAWVTKFALVCGLGMANNWAMIGFLPLFLIALVWMKGVTSLTPGFLLRLFGLGFVGFLFIFLLPIINSLSHSAHLGFWQTLRTIAVTEKRLLFNFPRDMVVVLSLTSVLPVMVMGIRWASYFGDNSPFGIFLATCAFHIVHAAFLLICLWVALDAPISPRYMGHGFPFLTYYYLGALSVGYFCGYFLLIFGTKIPKSRQTLHPLLSFTNFVITALMWVVVIAMPAILVGKNLPPLRTNQTVSRIYENYFTQIAELLPAQGAIVLSDDSPRLSYLQAVLNRHNRNSANLFIDTGLIGSDPGYYHFLVERNPQFQISTSWTNIPASAPPALATIQVIDHLAQTHEVYYLHPSFGFFFEKYYQEPRGLIFRLKPYPGNQWDVPEASRELIAYNQTFWKKTFDDVLPPLTGILDLPVSPPHPNVLDQFLKQIHLKMERPWLALPVGGFYSHALDYWGVELHRAGLMEEAARCFEQARELNPANVAARINTAFNKNLRAGKRIIIQPPKNLEEQLGGRWTDILGNYGPIDEPNVRDGLAPALAEGGNYRQAVQQLDRVKSLAPNDLLAPLQLAQLFLFMGSYTNGLSFLLPESRCYPDALENCDFVLKQEPHEPTALFLKGAILIQLKDYNAAIEPLNQIISLQTNNYAALLNRAIAYYKTGNYKAAKPDYEAVGKIAPRAFQVYFGLGGIAESQKDTSTAVKNYEMYLSNAPPNTEESRIVTTRLQELKSSSR